jgi:hypothetical protein
MPPVQRQEREAVGLQRLERVVVDHRAHLLLDRPDAALGPTASICSTAVRLSSMRSTCTCSVTGVVSR